MRKQQEVSVPAPLLDDSPVRVMDKAAYELMPSNNFALVYESTNETGKRVVVKKFPLNSRAGVKFAAERFDHLAPYLPVDVLKDYAAKVANACKMLDVPVPHNIVKFLGDVERVNLKVAHIPAELVEDQPLVGEKSNKWMLPNEKFAMVVSAVHGDKVTTVRLFPLETRDEIKYAAEKFAVMEQYLLTNRDKATVAERILKAAKEVGMLDEVLQHEALKKWSFVMRPAPNDLPKFAYEKKTENDIVVDFPVSTPIEVIESIERFNKYGKVIIRNELDYYKTARTLYKVAKALGIEIDEEYLKKLGADEYVLQVWKKAMEWNVDVNVLEKEIDLRIRAADHHGKYMAKEAYEKFIKQAREIYRRKGKLDPIGTYQAIAQLDREFEMDKYIGQYRFSKSAATLMAEISSWRPRTQGFNVSGREIDERRLRKLASTPAFVDELARVAGREFADQFVSFPVETFKKADVNYKSLIVSLAETGKFPGEDEA